MKVRVQDLEKRCLTGRDDFVGRCQCAKETWVEIKVEECGEDLGSEFEAAIRGFVEDL